MTIKRPIQSSLASGLVIAAAGCPVVAQARPFPEPPSPPSASSTAIHQQSQPTGAVTTSGPIVRMTTRSGGFDWGDAGIGAAGGLALSILGVGGALVVSQRRVRRSSRSTATAS